jgi:excisionase family DNA binding protein
MPPNPDTRVAVTVAELARRMSISKATAYEWVRTGIVPSVRIKGCIRIPVRALHDAIESGCRPSCQCVCHEGAA